MVSAVTCNVEVTSQNSTQSTSNQTIHQSNPQDDLKFPGTEEIKFLPDHPIQLVRPDPHQHKMLEVITDNIRHLHYIGSAVSVVAVVGKFHSGKSFLLNQLMGKPDGFGIGPTVRPHTMGIWMWGKVRMGIIFLVLVWINCSSQY